MNEHRFSWVYGSSHRALRPSYDKILWETEKFVAIPSLGSLVPGWILLVPKRQIANFSQLTKDETSELKVLLPEVACAVSHPSSKAFVFEHGGQIGSTLSCGVDQAHLHVVPLAFDLCAQVLKCDDVKWIKLENSFALFGEHAPYEYLFVSDLAGMTYRGRPDLASSQWFRKQIAAGIGKGDQWNYRDYPHFRNMDLTCEMLGSLNDSRQAV
jgi:ATP adenylyltransferase